MQVRRAPGNTCLSACAKGATGTIEAPINDSKGCGGVMRVAPIGLVREFTVERAYALALRAAAQTHGHPEGYLPAGALAAIVRSLVDGATLEAAAAASLRLLARTPESKPTAEAIRAVLSPNTSVRALGEGWVGEEALAIGLHAALAGRDFADAIRLAAHHSGDSDSTASIAGQITGAALGEAALPAGCGGVGLQGGIV